MKKILLAMSVIAVLFLTGCKNVHNENDAVPPDAVNQGQEIIDKDSKENQDLSVTKIGKKVLTSSERLELINANNLEVRDEERLKPLLLSLNFEQTAKINDKNITLKLEIGDYNIVYEDLLLYFDANIKAYDEQQKIIGDYSLKIKTQLGNGNGPKEVVDERAKSFMDNFEVHVRHINDTSNSESYFVFTFHVDSGEGIDEEFYIYKLDGEKIMYCYERKGPYANTIFKDGYGYSGEIDWCSDHYIFVDTVDYCEDKIYVYDMNTYFEIDDENIEYQEIVEVNDAESSKDNVRHKITIENGKIVDEIIKIYESIPKGQF